MAPYNKFSSSISSYEQLLQNFSKLFDNYDVLSSITRYEQLLQDLSKPYDTYNRIFERMSQIGEQIQNFSNSVMITSASIVRCLDTFERMREGLITKLIPSIEYIQKMQDMISLLDTKLPSPAEVPVAPEIIEEPESTSVAISEDTPRKRYTVQDVIAVLTLLLTLFQMLTSAIDSKRTEALQQKEIQIMEEELRVMEEQRDYVASLCEELLTILDESESTPSPSPTLEPAPPMSDTAEISVPLEAEVVPGTGPISPLESEVAPGTDSSSDDVSDNQSKNSETN